MRRWLTIAGLLLVVALLLILARCGEMGRFGETLSPNRADKEKTEDRVTGSEPPERKYQDATEIPGAMVIRPVLDPNMVYDSEAKRTTDRRTGEYFTSSLKNPINGIHQGTIRDSSSNLLYYYEYRYSAPRLPSGEAKTIYEIIWSMRGDDYRRLREIGGQNEAMRRAKSDSLDRLASFMRAQRIGYYSGVEKGEIVLADRRMDDLRGEMR